MLNRYINVSVLLLCGILILFGCSNNAKENSSKGLKEEVIEFVAKEKDVDKNKIDASNFTPNLQGEKNKQISIKIDGDKKTYNYYKNKEGDIKLFSYIDENREQHIVDK